MIDKRSWIYSIFTTAIFSLPLTVMLLTGIYFIIERSLNDLEFTAIQSGKMMGAFLNVNVNQLQVLASNHIVCNASLPIETRLNAITPYADINRIRNIFITDRSGRGLGLDGSIHDFSGDGYFLETMRGKPGISLLIRDDRGMQRFFAISAPLYSRNIYSGSIIQYMPWDGITLLINAINFDKSGFAYIGERNGSFTTFPNPLAGKNKSSGIPGIIDAASSSKMEKIQSLFSSGESGSGEYSYEGKRKLIGFAPIPGTTWSIGITTPRSEVLENTWIMVLLYGIMIALMIVLTETYYKRKLTLQLEKDNAITNLQAVKEKLEAQSDIISSMAERRISETESQYHDLFETMSSGAILHEMILDADGTPVNFRYLSINSMAEKIFHIDRKALIGKTYRDVYPTVSEETIQTMKGIAFGDKPTRLPDFETDEGLVICNSAYSPKPGQFVTLYDDITEEVRAKEALEIEREKLIKATQAAEEANRSKSKFLANMSHEIRTPLNAIIGLADVEIETHEEPLTVRTFTAIRESAKNLMSLLNDILDYSKMEAGKFTLERSAFSLEEVVNNALTVTTPRLNGKHVDMLVDFDPTLHSTVMGDAVRVWQILKNLLDNAGKFTNEGQILLRIQNKGASLIQFTVSDTGCGINPDQIEKLFEVFEQGNSDLARRTGGTGLGLSITKQLIEMMNGTIQVESIPGKGTTFTVTLPLESAPDTQSAYQLPEEASLLAGKKILVADDDPNARLIIKAILDKAGSDTTSAASGEEAIDLIIQDEKEGKEYDIVILDLLLPKLNGIETANELSRALHYKPRFILVTAWSKNFSVDEIVKAGFSETIDKPFVPSTVIKKVAYVIGQGEQAGARNKKERREQYPDAKVLAVEDNPQNRDVINRMLFLFGIRPEFAVDGLEAIEKTKECRYDLILMDIQMPEMNGLEATKLIRAREKLENLKPMPIVAMTAYAMAEDIRQSLDVGMDAHITKPIEIGMLRNTLEKYIGDKKKASENRESAPDGDTASVENPFPQLSCVNTTEGLVRLGNDHNLYLRLLSSLRDMLERPQPEFDTAMSGDAINATAKFIHTLKGIAGNLSVTGLYAISSELESNLRTHKPQKRKYNQYREICGEVFAELNDKLPKKDLKAEKKTVLKEGTDEELSGLLEKLVMPLETGDAFAVDAIIENLRAKKFKRLPRKTIEELCRLAALFDYEGILEKINGLH